MYTDVKFKLTKSQIEKIHHAARMGVGVKLRLSSVKMSPNGNYSLPLTQKEIAKLHDGKVHDVTISHKRLKDVKQGGILPIIPVIAGLIAAAATTAGGVAGAVSNAKSAKAADAQRAAAEAAERLANAKLAEVNKK